MLETYICVVMALARNNTVAGSGCELWIENANKCNCYTYAHLLTIHTSLCICTLQTFAYSALPNYNKMTMLLS